MVQKMVQKIVQKMVKNGPKNGPVHILPYTQSSSFLREDTEEGAKLVKRIGGHLKTLQAISCISFILLYDWSSRLREEITELFCSGTVMGSSFVLFYVSMEITPGQFRSGESGYTQKRPVGKRYFPWVKGLVYP